MGSKFTSRYWGSRTGEDLEITVHDIINALPNWQLVPDVRAKHFIPVPLMPVPVEKGIESTEAFKLLEEISAENHA